MFDVRLQIKLGEFALQTAFTAPPGITVLFGPSGAGKSTVLNAIAGLIKPQSGRVQIDDMVLYDHSIGLSLPPHRRRLGLVFQEGRLFPHLTVKQNLLFGRWFAPRDARPPALADIVSLLGIAPLLARRPASLSGGERQRVAIGRALLMGPRALLMDEPLASLDSARKAEILPYLEKLRDQAGLPILYVTHSVEERDRLAALVVTLG